MAYLEVDSFSYSEPYTVNGVFNELAGPLKRGDTAFTFNKAEVGLARGNWRLGVFKRYDYHLEFTPDMARLVYQSERDMPLDNASTYRLELQARHLEAEGIGIAYTWRINDNLWLRPRLNVLQGSGLMAGELNGRVVTSAEGTYSSTLRMDYFYSEDPVFEREVERPVGEGASLDLHVGWRPHDQVTFELEVLDGWSEIRWREAPRTVAQGSTDNVAVTPEGHIDTQAVVSGIESNEHFKQRLLVRGRLAVSWQWHRTGAFQAELFQVRSISMPRLGYQWHFARSGHLKTLYDFKAEAVSVGLGYAGFSLRLTSDDPEFDKANTVGLSLAYQRRL